MAARTGARAWPNGAGWAGGWSVLLAAATLGWPAADAAAAPSAAAPGAARRADAPGAETRTFAIPAEPLDAAVLEFAVQAHLSISADEVRHCRAQSNEVRGRYTLRDALALMLAGTGCDFQLLDGEAAIITAAAPPAGVAEPPPEPPPDPDVIITATRRPVPLDKAPYAVSVVSGRTLDEGAGAAPPDAGALAARFAGVTVTNLGSGRNKIFLRGLSDGALTGRTQSTVGYYEDNVRITYDAPDPDLPLIDVDRVEVLRGPQGALYGGGSIGGIFHVVTRQPDAGAFAAMAASTVAATATGAPSGAVEGMINLPLVRDRLAVRAVGWLDVSGGVVDDIALGRRNADRTSRQGVRINAALALAPHWRVSAGATRQAINSADTHYAQAGLGPYQRALNLREPHDNDFVSVYATIEGDTRLGAVTQTTAVVRHDLGSRYDATLARAIFAPAAVGSGEFDETDTVETLLAEAHIVSPERGRLRWIAGAFASVGDKKSTARFSLQNAPPGSSIAYSEDRRDDVDEAAVYGQASLSITRALSVSGGMRWFNSRLAVASTIDRPLETSAASYAARLSDSGLAPQIGVNFAPPGAASYYALASEGYRAGGFNTADGDRGLYSTGPGAPQPARRFKPDEMWNYEAGARLTLLGARVHVRAAAFFARWKDVQVDRLLASGLSYTSNAGEGQNRGLELEARYDGADGVSLEGHGAWSSPELARPDPSFPGTADSGLPGVPNLSYGLDARYRRALSPRWTATIGATYDYVGPSHLTFDAATAPQMGDYSTISASASLASATWRLTAFVENLADTAGDTFAYGNPFSLRSIAQSTAQRPRTIGVTLRRDF
jgi:outer membrane receptor protein involved in Fe transport